MRQYVFCDTHKVRQHWQPSCTTPDGPREPISIRRIVRHHFVNKAACPNYSQVHRRAINSQGLKKQDKTYISTRST